VDHFFGGRPTPSRDTSGNIVGYHSNRRVPNKQVIGQHIDPLYKKLYQIEQSASGAKEGLDNSFKAVVDMLGDAKMNFNQFMFSLGV